MKEKFKLLTRKASLLAIVAVVSALSCVCVFAESGGSGTANTAVVDAMTTVANDALATGTAVIPLALSVVGLTLVVVFGIKVFRRIFGR